MTVRELIRRLQEAPSDASVLVDEQELASVEITDDGESTIVILWSDSGDY